jgi:hypothetical protein
VRRVQAREATEHGIGPGGVHAEPMCTAVVNDKGRGIHRPLRGRTWLEIHAASKCRHEPLGLGTREVGRRVECVLRDRVRPPLNGAAKPADCHGAVRLSGGRLAMTVVADLHVSERNHAP